MDKDQVVGLNDLPCCKLERRSSHHGCGLAFRAITVPPDPSPMDYMPGSKFIDGRWLTFDARHNVPRGRITGMILLFASLAVSTAITLAFLA